MQAVRGTRTLAAMSVQPAAMNFLPRLLLPWLLLCSAVVGAQTPTADDLVQAQRALERATGLTAAQRETAQQQLEQARETLAEAAAIRQRSAERRSTLMALPAQQGALQASLDSDNEADLRAWTARLPAGAGADDLELLLEQERRTTDSLRDEIDRVGAELAGLLSQPSLAGESAAALRHRIDSLSAPVPATEGESAVLASIRRLQREAELERLRAQLEEASLVEEGSRAEQALLELRLRELRHRLARHEARLPVLQQRITAMARSVLGARLEALRDQQVRFGAQDGPLARLAEQNLGLGEELLAGSDALDRQREVATAAVQAGEMLRTVLRDTRTRLELGGGSAQVGQWLWRERIRLPSQVRLRAQLAGLRSVLADLRVRLIEINEWQRNVGDLDAAIARALADSGAAAQPARDSEGRRVQARFLLEQQVDLLAQLDALLRRRIAAVEQAITAVSSQRGDAQALQAVLDRNLLWTPSHEPVSRGWLASVPAGLGELVSPGRLAEAGVQVRRVLSQRAVEALLCLVSVLALLSLRRHVPARLESLALPVRNAREDRFRYTLQAVLLTVLAALPLPAALYAAGWLLQEAGDGGRASDALGTALRATALPALLCAYLSWLVRDRGLAHAHFRWTQARRSSIANGVRWLAPPVLLTTFVIVLAFARNHALAIDVQVRLAVIVLTLLGAGWNWYALVPERLWSVRGTDTTTSHVRRLLRVGLPALCLGVAVLALSGYLYSAAVVVRALLSSLGVFVAVASIVGVVGRWFLVGERRLALLRREQKRQAQDGEQALLAEAEADIALETISAHSRRILRALRLGLLGVGLVWVWAEVLPAFARLDEITVWSFGPRGGDGGVAQTPVTLLSLLTGSLVLVLTGIAARNLPGLMELTLLSRSRLDVASRYAITSLFRYALVIVGVLAGFSLFGLRWAQLQWMAAALTVGLGFGLQEIFANFVSGLILLFERPFRIGDTITVGGKTGVVTRIRTRATTLRDGEGREIFIPNKAFITGELTNWSLNENPTSITIEYGVAYGSDIPAVHEAALEAARGNARVLREPAPVSAFKNFEGNVMVFELKVYLASLSDRVPARSELALALATLLKARGIQMSPSQMDIHIRSLPSTEPLRG